MKAIYKNIAMAALALSAVACSQEDDFSSSYLNDPDAVRINAQVGKDDVTGGFTRSNPLGDATAQAKFNTGDQIAVAAGTQAPVVYQLGTDGWNPVGDAYLKWQANEMNVTAYYPVGKNNASATTFTVPTAYTEESPIADADYMTYSGSQTKGDDKAINLTMERKMVRIVVDEIFFNDQFAEDYSVTAIKVHANTAGYADGEPEADNIQVSALQQEGDFYALLAPTTEDNNATFLTVTVAHKTNSEDVHTLNVKGIPATTAGNSYNYSLTVGKDIAKIGAVTVNDWTGAIIEGGEAEEIPYKYDATTNTYNVYLSEGVQTAFDEAELTGTTENPATVKLMADVEVKGTPDEHGYIYYDIVVDGGVIILDLNGHTITGSDSNQILGVGDERTKKGCTLTINDSSEGKQGKIIGGDETSTIYVCYSNLIVNNGNFVGKYCVKGFDAISITINGGTFKATRYAIHPQNTTLTITGGTFEGDRGALTFTSGSTALIYGGSFTGGEHDISTSGKTGFLSYNADGTGPTFPDGLSIYVYNNCPTLSQLLSNDAAYYDADGNQITEGLDGTAIEGDVMVKKIPTE